MEKRLFLAIILSICVLLVYSSISGQFLKKEPKNLNNSVEISQNIINKPIENEFEIPPLLEEVKNDSDSYKLFDNSKLQIKIDIFGGGIKEVFIKDYNSFIPQKNIVGIVGFDGENYKESIINDLITLSYSEKKSNLIINQEFEFEKDKYFWNFKIKITNNSKEKSYVNYGLILGSIENKILKNSVDQRYYEFSIAFQDSVLRKQLNSLNSLNLDKKPLWIGIRDRYFCSILISDTRITKIEKISNEKGLKFVAIPETIEILPGETKVNSFRVYTGPQTPALISEFEHSSEQIIHYGFFDTISKMLLGVLRTINKVCKNWGVTLIVFSILVFVVLSPLSIKSFSSMKKMQELQPEIEELKSRFKDSPQKLNKELMNLYKEKKINPFGGCLPVLLQMPIFVSLFQLLMRFVDLKGAKFLWISDLSLPDRVFVLSKSLPVIGNEINLLPIIMIITMLIQQKITTFKQTGAQDAAQQQKMMSLVMSVFFGIIFYHMPSGLVLYWTINSILMLVFQSRFLFAKNDKK